VPQPNLLRRKITSVGAVGLKDDSAHVWARETKASRQFAQEGWFVWSKILGCSSQMGTPAVLIGQKGSSRWR